ncbi:DEAD/DEAH box helicase [Desulfosarcina sp.]|uniref:DEAD/DEAH box helicase n=1 Tax=Desulfosarcina sp. TaxID=2027861 RepID=UPI0029BBE33E|nr:DEAD/DEAH box helicase [Desulfosarcina sp.]MDX2451215.1 DEAD/DEAH box helicase [Desulfosarcina sp.]MDX2489045.1 DEAD/DEAH box helicase [Desulfosarcina sp.]
MDFKTTGLRAELLRALEELGFDAPMPIQAAALPELLNGSRDFIGLAQTGTGKTAAFGLPLLQRVDADLKSPQGVILCPTRELCLQITDDLKRYGRYLPRIRVAAVYGGASIAHQIRQLRDGSQIVVATPGRLIDLMQRRAVDLSHTATCVLDEADEMLNMGFKEDIDRILGKMPADRRTWLFSATMPSGVAAIAKTYLDDPHKVSLGGRQHSAPNITHACYVMNERHRYQGLKRIIDFTPGIFALVFCRTRRETQSVADALVQEGYPADALHGDLSQAQRDHVMGKFRRQSIRLLVATDVAARGLDVDEISHIIHYNLPDDADIYTHRSGRTARAGRSGVSIALSTPREIGRLRAMERANAMRFEFRKFPDGRAICERQLDGFVDRIVETPVDPKAFASYLPAVSEALEGLDREELILRFMAADFNRIFKDYREAGDINAAVRPAAVRPAGKSRKVRPEEPGAQRFFINVGRLDKINEGAIVRLVCDHSGIRSRQIGRIELKREFSFFEVARAAADKVRRSLKDVPFDGRRVQVKDAGNKHSQGKPDRIRKIRPGIRHAQRRVSA